MKELVDFFYFYFIFYFLCVIGTVEYTQFHNAVSKIAGPFDLDALQSWLLTSQVLSHHY